MKFGNDGLPGKEGMNVMCSVGVCQRGKSSSTFNVESNIIHQKRITSTPRLPTYQTNLQEASQAEEERAKLALAGQTVTNKSKLTDRSVRNPGCIKQALSVVRFSSAEM